SDLVEAQHVRRVRRCRGGVGMYFEEEGIRARRYRGAHQTRDVLRLTTAHSPALSRSLHRMGAIEDHGPLEDLPERHEVSHVHDEITVPEERPALGDGNAASPGRPGLTHRASHLV